VNVEQMEPALGLGHGLSLTLANAASHELYDMTWVRLFLKFTRHLLIFPPSTI
jgi:hypothetical protein